MRGPDCYMGNCGCGNNSGSRNCSGKYAMTTISLVGGNQGAVGNMTTTTNNVSDAPLGDLLMIVEFQTASVNPINETYIEVSTVSNVTIMPPNATGGMTIN